MRKRERKPQVTKNNFLRILLPVLFFLQGCPSGGAKKENADLISVSAPAVSYNHAGYSSELGSTAQYALGSEFQNVFSLSGATGLSSCVYLQDKGLWQGALGVESHAANSPITASSIFHAGSIGKLVTASLILQLMEQGRIQSNTPLSRWFPNTRNSEEITIGHLLSHTSGLAANALESGAAVDHEQMVSAALGQGLLYKPGTGFSYSNIGYITLGLVLEKEYQMPLSDIMNVYIFNALGLNQTQSITRENKDELLVESTHNGRPGRESIDYSSVGGAGIVASTPCDLIRLLNQLLAGNIVQPQTLDKMLSKMFPMSPEGGLYWGQGLMVLETPVGRVFYLAGRIKGFGAVAAYHPRLKAYVAVMVNDDTQVDPVMLRLFQKIEGM